ncbi:ATP-binding cassette sub-family B member 6-like isoform X2 [Cylas formicarius]|uniref:ATP-binding cassette sub-family B member 6-like isoform X2 n=1 Tax=Cylas formicarius TaxID=197179 RepID=UPI0029584099|nr:ATP-binding cassette sub-family B member 6-like isoform X2 [Cylas formicarius]
MAKVVDQFVASTPTIEPGVGKCSWQSKLISILTAADNADKTHQLGVDYDDGEEYVQRKRATFCFLQGGGLDTLGFLNDLRSLLWVAVQQYTSREVKVTLFRHLHGLSLSWHLNRKTGEVLRVMDRGTESVDNLINVIFFSLAPAVIDILIAVIYLCTAFNYWFGITVLTTLVMYVAVTVILIESRSDIRRAMNEADNKRRGRSVDSLLNFETVKYYNAENYEVETFNGELLKFQGKQLKANLTLNILHCSQNVVLCAGLLAGSLMAARMATETSTSTVGDYVMFLSYVVQLYGPLNMFGFHYRQIQNSFVDMENMLDLLEQEPAIVDCPDATSLDVNGGAIQFERVTFGYVSEEIVLKEVSFSLMQGQTVALVGPSGSGKSTILRLLFRFYDADAGSIKLDGQNIEHVSQNSLRKAIGVVPQDTVLFNNTVKFNIKYGRMDASDADVIEASKGADIHDRIMTFPEAYGTIVGERGLRLSGGEKQRVAIARTLLKAPEIVLLDEATSSLDTHAERNIQASLRKLCEHRTTLIVAHRLSTVIHADEILVLKDGEVVERGRHSELVEKEGLYCDMWKRQLDSGLE